MIPKQIVEKAIEGGYTLAKIEGDDVYTENPYSSIVLQPAFWQALGKALVWKDMTIEEMGHFREDDNFRHYHHMIGGHLWHYHASRFYDLILTEQPIGSFWKELLTNSTH